MINRVMMIKHNKYIILPEIFRNEADRRPAKMGMVKAPLGCKILPKPKIKPLDIYSASR